MPTLQILGRRDQILLNNAEPAAGYHVNIYEPNTLTRITSYQDSLLSQANPNPVVLSGSGRASIWISRNADVRITDPVTSALLVEDLAVNPEDLSGTEDSGLISNGSFEIDTDANNIPDGWTNDVNNAGSSNSIDITESTSGGQSWRTQSAGSGGGELVTTDFFPVNDTDQLRVNFDLRSTIAAVRNIVRVEFYDVSQVTISNVDVYDSTANPATFTSQNLLATPPAGARFAKIRIIGGTTGGEVAGITYWDNFTVFYPQIVAGVFDNITIQNNDIISTNTNGNINITPNGTGRTVVAALTADAPILDEPQLRDSADAVRVEVSTTSLRVRTDIVTATPPTSEAVTGLYEIFDADGGDRLALIGFNGANDLRVINQMHGGAISLLSQDSAGVVQSILAGDPDGTTQLYAAGVQRIIARTGGAAAVKSDGNTDTEFRGIFLEHQNATPRGFIGNDSTSSLVLRNNIHGGAVVLDGEDAGGTLRTLLVGDPDSSTTLFDSGSPRLATATLGRIAVRSDGNTDVENRHVRLEHNDTTLRGLMGYSGNADLRLENRVHGGSVVLAAEDNGGVSRNLLTADPDNNTILFERGNDRFYVDSLGVRIRADFDSDSQDYRLRFQHNNGTDRGLFGFLGSDIFRIRNQVHGADVRLEAEDVGGVLRSVINGDPDGVTTAFYAGSPRARTQASGEFSVVSDGNSDAETRRLLFEHNGGALRGALGYSSGPNLELANLIHGGRLILSAEDSGGVTRTAVDIDPDGNLAIFHPSTGNLVVRTADPTATGVTSGAEIKDHLGNFRPVGYNDLPPVTTNSSVTLAAQHAGGVIYHNNASVQTITLPASTDLDFPVHKMCTIVNNTDTAITLNASVAGMTLLWQDGTNTEKAGSRAIAGRSVANLWRHSAGIIHLWGNGIS